MVRCASDSDCVSGYACAGGVCLPESEIDAGQDITNDTVGPQPAVLTLSEAPVYDFGEVFIGDTAENTFTVFYSGEVSATAVSVLGLSAPFHFKGGSYPGEDGTCGLTISADCTIILTFIPTVADESTDTLELNYYDGQTTQGATKELHGTGKKTADLTISEEPGYDFGKLFVGNRADKGFTITNIGNRQATSIEWSGLDAPFAFNGGAGTCGTTLDPGENCTIVVAYNPTARGTHPDTIQIDFRDGAEDKTVFRNLQGRGVAWNYVGNPGFTNGEAEGLSLFVDNETPYLAYQEGATPVNGSVMFYNQSQWVYLGNRGFTNGGVYNPKLFIANGIPYVAYQDVEANGSPAVMYFEQNQWKYVGTRGFTTHGVAGRVSLFVDNNTPYLFFGDLGAGMWPGTAMYYNHTSWEYLGGIPGFTEGPVSSPSIFAYDNTAYVFYRDENAGGNGSVMYYNQTQWVYLGGRGFTEESAEQISAYIYNGTPFIFFRDNGQNGSVMYFQQGQWEYLGLRGATNGDIQEPALSVNDGTPYIAFEEQGGNFHQYGSVMYFNQSAWVYLGNRGFTEGPVYSTSFFVYSGTPYFAFRGPIDGPFGNNGSVMKFD